MTVMATSLARRGQKREAAVQPANFALAVDAIARATALRQALVTSAEPSPLSGLAGWRDAAEID
jgi:hypothetical protein